MNKKDECEIVKDLAIPYTEELVNIGSKKFIKEHLSQCESCTQYYKNIKSEINKENTREKNKDNIVVDQFKKINRHINVLKITLISIFIFIIIASSVFYFKYQRTVSIIDNAYSKIEYLRELNNYKLKVKTIQKNLVTDDYMEYEQNYYYKDGKYKIESNDSIKFYQDNSYEKICIYHDLKEIQYYKQDFVEEKKGRLFDIFSEIINYKDLISKYKFYSYILSVREDRYNGINCYVIRFGDSNGYRDTWINKDNFATVRVINETYNSFYREVIYTIYENVVREEDITTSILNLSEYNNYTRKEVINNKTEEFKMYYELYEKKD